MGRADTLRIEVIYCAAPGQVDHCVLQLGAGSTAADAVQASGLLQRHAFGATALQIGIWGKRCEAQAALRDGDRVELYRGLLVDPKEARRQRYQQHKSSKAARAAAPARSAAKTR